MSIFLVNGSLEGSTGYIVKTLHKEIINNNLKAYIAYGNHLSVNEHFYLHKNNVSKSINKVVEKLTGLDGFLNIGSTKELIKLIIELKPSIVHLHNIHSNFISMPLLLDYLNNRKIKVVWTLHDTWAYTGKCSYYGNCNKWVNGCSNCPLLREYPQSYLFDLTKYMWEKKKDTYFKVHTNLTIVPVSKWLENDVKKSILKDSNIVQIYNGIDLADFELKSTIKNLTSKKIILGVANPWNKRKGIHFFNYLSEHLDDSYEIRLIGAKNYSGDLSKKIIDLPLIFDKKNLAKEYQNADLFINPALNDNFPTTHIESLACGTPVMTFDVGGCSESLTENTGIVLKNINEVDLLESVISFFNKNISYFTPINCRKRGELFSHQIMKNNYLKLYKTLL
jgi:putative colanic acid biosynthesis glycosyltransferase